MNEETDFSYDDLPSNLKTITEIFYDAREAILINVDVYDQDQMQIGLRKLLEAKISFFRATTPPIAQEE
jgi:hypothetical protein